MINGDGCSAGVDPHDHLTGIGKHLGRRNRQFQHVFKGLRGGGGRLEKKAREVDVFFDVTNQKLRRRWVSRRLHVEEERLQALLDVLQLGYWVLLGTTVHSSRDL